MGIYGEIQEMRAEDESKARRQAERSAGARKFAAEAIVHECRDREPADSDAYDEGYHDGYMACLKDMCEAAGIRWADVMDEAMAAMGLYRCPERIGGRPRNSGWIARGSALRPGSWARGASATRTRPGTGTHTMTGWRRRA